LDIEEIGRRIQSAYDVTGNKLGYRFLYCPRERLLQHNGILVLGLNPGGTKYEISLEVPEGLAYKVEGWGEGKYSPGESPIQAQILLLLSRLSDAPEECVASNLVFFRSQSWQELFNEKQSVKVCCDIWKDLLKDISGIHTIIYIGKKTFDYAKVNGLYEYDDSSLIKRELWAGGSWSVLKDVDQRKHIVLPHLSRWRFINEQSDAFKELLTHA
jgi:hypothetical protein